MTCLPDENGEYDADGVNDVGECEKDEIVGVDADVVVDVDEDCEFDVFDDEHEYDPDGDDERFHGEYDDYVAVVVVAADVGGGDDDDADDVEMMVNLQIKVRYQKKKGHNYHHLHLIPF